MRSRLTATIDSQPKSFDLRVAAGVVQHLNEITTADRQPHDKRLKHATIEQGSVDFVALPARVSCETKLQFATELGNLRVSECRECGFESSARAQPLWSSLGRCRAGESQ